MGCEDVPLYLWYPFDPTKKKRNI